MENRHESLCAYGLAAVFLPHHQCHILWVVLKMVDERLALPSYGLVDKYYFSMSKKNTPQVVRKKVSCEQKLHHATSDEAECWGLALIPHRLRIVLASRW